MSKTKDGFKLKFWLDKKIGEKMAGTQQAKKDADTDAMNQLIGSTNILKEIREELHNGAFDSITHDNLRSLSDITADEKIKIAVLFGWDYGDNQTKINSVDDLFSENGYYHKVTNIKGSTWCKVIDYLRSIGVDL